MRQSLGPSLSLVIAVATLLAASCASTGQVAPPSEMVTAEAYLTPREDLRPIARAPGEKLRVLATTSILADVVSQVGGEQVSLQSLIPAGVDPHAFEPNPADARALADAEVVFISGFGLEEFMADLIAQAGNRPVVVSASLGIEPLTAEAEHGQEHTVDPHTWFDPNNVIHWTENIQAALAAVDPDNADIYADNAARYKADLEALDADIRASVARIPPEHRRLVTDHEELGYFAEEYGFQVVGTVLPSTSSLAEPSAQDLAALSDRIQAEGVPAIFVSSIVNPGLAAQIADDVGVRVVALYGHSLTGAEGPAGTYLDLMRYNAQAIAEALAP